MTPRPQLPHSKPSPHDLIVQFLADIMRSTVDAASPTAFQQALQTYCDSLRPWLEPKDSPLQPREVFSLLEHCTFDETGENVAVVLSPEAEALFRAWLRRNQICSKAGFNTAQAWSN